MVSKITYFFSILLFLLLFVVQSNYSYSMEKIIGEIILSNTDGNFEEKFIERIKQIYSTMELSNATAIQILYKYLLTDPFVQPLENVAQKIVGEMFTDHAITEEIVRMLVAGQNFNDSQVNAIASLIMNNFYYCMLQLTATQLRNIFIIVIGEGDNIFKNMALEEKKEISLTQLKKLFDETYPNHPGIGCDTSIYHQMVAEPKEYQLARSFIKTVKETYPDIALSDTPAIQAFYNLLSNFSDEFDEKSLMTDIFGDYAKKDCCADVYLYSIQIALSKETAGQKLLSLFSKVTDILFNWSEAQLRAIFVLVLEEKNNEFKSLLNEEKNSLTFQELKNIFDATYPEEHVAANDESSDDDTSFVVPFKECVIL